jgi:hypothetical protein
MVRTPATARSTAAQTGSHAPPPLLTASPVRPDRRAGFWRRCFGLRTTIVCQDTLGTDTTKTFKRKRVFCVLCSVTGLVADSSAGGSLSSAPINVTGNHLRLRIAGESTATTPADAAAVTVHVETLDGA